MSHWNSSTTSMESPQPMDLSSDEKGPRRKIFVKTCPYCNDKYVIPIVFVSHLAGHIQFHSDLNLFKCNICDLVNRSSTVVALHVETHHAVKRSIFGFLTRITVCIGVFGRILRLSPAHCSSAEPSSG